MVSSVQKTIYVRAEDTALWGRAVEYAKQRRLPISSLIMNALQEYLERRHVPEDGD